MSSPTADRLRGRLRALVDQTYGVMSRGRMPDRTSMDTLLECIRELRPLAADDSEQSMLSAMEKSTEAALILAGQPVVTPPPPPSSSSSPSFAMGRLVGRMEELSDHLMDTLAMGPAAVRTATERLRDYGSQLRRMLPAGDGAVPSLDNLEARTSDILAHLHDSPQERPVAPRGVSARRGGVLRRQKKH